MSYLKPLCRHGWALYCKTLVTPQQAHSKLTNGAPSSLSTFPLLSSLHGENSLLIPPPMCPLDSMKSWNTPCSSSPLSSLLVNAICPNIAVKPIYRAWLATFLPLSLFIHMLLTTPMATCLCIYLISLLFLAPLELSGLIHLSTSLVKYNSSLVIIESVSTCHSVYWGNNTNN